MDQGEKGMKLKNYVYRVEFQARLAPHIHGCAWLRDEEIKDFFMDDTSEYKTNKIPELINKFITCKIA